MTKSSLRLFVISIVIAVEDLGGLQIFDIPFAIANKEKLLALSAAKKELRQQLPKDHFDKISLKYREIKPEKIAQVTNTQNLYAASARAFKRHSDKLLYPNVCNTAFALIAESFNEANNKAVITCNKVFPNDKYTMQYACCIKIPEFIIENVK